MNGDIFELLSPEECYSKTHGNDFFETYNSHVNLCMAFVEPVLKKLNYHNSIDDVKRMVQLHDIGKLGTEFQDRIKGGAEPQYIHHTELAFINWLNKDENIKELKLPYILAILAHHKTLIDEESAILIERFISNHPNWKKLSKEWLGIIKRQTPDRIDYEFLSALKLIDILRTVDILASFTSETIYKQYIKKSDIPKSLFESKYLFSWDTTPENGNVRLVEFLKQSFDLDWVKTAKIENIDNGVTIRVSSEKNSLSLRLSDEKTKVNLKIDDGRHYELIVKNKNGKLNIYKPGFSEVSKELSCINIRTDEIKYETLSDDGKTVKICLNFPVKSVIEYVRREKS